MVNGVFEPVPSTARTSSIVSTDGTSSSSAMLMTPTPSAMTAPVAFDSDSENVSTGSSATSSTIGTTTVAVSWLAPNDSTPERAVKSVAPAVPSMVVKFTVDAGPIRDRVTGTLALPADSLTTMSATRSSGTCARTRCTSSLVSRAPTNCSRMVPSGPTSRYEGNPGWFTPITKYPASQNAECFWPETWSTGSGMWN